MSIDHPLILRIYAEMKASLPRSNNSPLWMVLAAQSIRVSVSFRLHHHPFLPQLPNPKSSANATHLSERIFPVCKTFKLYNIAFSDN